MDTDTDHRNAGTETLDDARRAGRRLGSEAAGAAQDTYARARSAAEGQAERGKSAAASEIENVADALRKAAGDMRHGSPQERTFGQIAESLADASEAIRDRDFGQIAGDVSDFARRNPLAFLGGAALAGFAVTRFAKSSQSVPRGGSTTDHGTSAHREDGRISSDSMSAGGLASGGTVDTAATGSAGTAPTPDTQGDAHRASDPASGLSSPAVATRGAIPAPATRPVADAEGVAPATRPSPVTTIPEDRS